MPALTARSSARSGIWDPYPFGHDARVRDAPGVDQTSLNGEGVIVRNVGTTPIDLASAAARLFSLTSWFYFTPGSVLAPDASCMSQRLALHELDRAVVPEPRGREVRRGRRLPARSPHVGPLLRRVPLHHRLLGPPPGRHGDHEGKPQVAQRRRVAVANEEYVIIKNGGCASGAAGRLLPPTTCVDVPLPARHAQLPGAILTVRIGKGSATPVTQFWGRSAPLLSNRQCSCCRTRTS